MIHKTMYIYICTCLGSSQSINGDQQGLQCTSVCCIHLVELAISCIALTGLCA
jgi:hypothetical protein